MLRRKLLVFLGAVVLLLVVTAAAALWLLQDVLERQDNVTSETMVAVENINTINADLARIQVELYQLQLGRKHRLDELINIVESLRLAIEALHGRPPLTTSEAAGLYESLRGRLDLFEASVGALATARDEELAMAHNQAALSATIEMQREGLGLGRLVRDHAIGEQRALTSQFRWTVIVLTAVFLLVINVSIVTLLHMARVVVEPVEKLVGASRELAEGRFQTRVHVKQHDEFDELAGSFNHLAQQLETTERRRLEILQQVALALNHELNNASAIIELQLSMLGRRSGGDPTQEKSLRQIHDSLQRMTSAVQDLLHARRIVLTEYVGGMQMLDLKESMKEAGTGST